jgi:hypothetical protein
MDDNRALIIDGIVFRSVFWRSFRQRANGIISVIEVFFWILVKG